MIIEQEISELIEDNMMSYSAAVLLNRAIPDFRDGLKPSTKRIIYTMHANKMDKFTKSLDVVGTVSKIHPHSSVYPSIINMCQTDKHVNPYLDYNGNMGQHTSRDIQAAADRYTDVRLSQYTMDLLGKSLSKDVVDWEYNYDGKIKIPLVLPFRFPTILTHAQSGIGVGFASSIASYNINEVSDNIINYCQGRKMKHLTPDFATGGLIVNNKDTISKINTEGSGSIKIRAKANIDGNEIVFTEIPYTTTREAIIDKIIEQASTKLTEVTNVIDLTGHNKMEIVITAIKGTNMDMLLEKLYMFTPLESSHSSNNMVLVDGLPVQLGTLTILEKWIEWRRKCIIREVEYDLKHLQEQLFEIDTLMKLNDTNIHEIIEIIRNNNKTKSIQLINKLGFTANQSEYLYTLRINQFNHEYIKNRLKERNPIEKQIKEVTKNKDNPDNIIIEDMKHFKKSYGSERLSKIIEYKEPEIKQVIKQELVDDNDYWITVTENGYLFKNDNKNSKKNILSTDKIKHQWKLNNSEDQIAVLTNSRQGYKKPIRDIDLDKTYFIPSLLEVEESDIAATICVSQYYPNIILLLTQGRIVKLSYESYVAGVNVYSNTHTDRFDLTDVLILDSENVLEITDIKNNKYTIDIKDIRTTKTRTGSGQFIHSTRRSDIKNIKIIK